MASSVVAPPLGSAGRLAAVSVADRRAELKRSRESLRERFAAQSQPARYLRDHRIAVDRVVRDVWRSRPLPADLALLAVGGYGRGELYPHSDVDVLLLLPRQLKPEEAAVLEAFISDLWDCGLEIGHAVRTIEDCIAEAKDITVITALLETRLLIGSRALFARFKEAVARHLDPADFFKRKRFEQEQRYEKYQDTPYALEPNLKESPGGLRDLQVILWVMRAAGIATSWDELAAKGVVTKDEARQLRRVERFLQETRIRLHLTAGRREDRILFDYQTALAQQLGLTGDTGKRPSEQLMQRYYRAAKAITQLNSLVLQNLDVEFFQNGTAEPQPFNERFQFTRELLDARDAELFEREPAAILEAFIILQQHPELKGMTAPTLRAIWRARRLIGPAFRRDAQNRARFIEILQQPQGIVHGLRRMNQSSVLGRYLPAFGRIVGQMQHDLFHVYTVDQHILQVVRNLRRFTMIEFSHEYPLLSRLIANFDRHWLLYVAAIFHDIAKGRGGDHSELGTVDARHFCRDHGLSAEDTELVVFLVRHHLTMSSVAQKQDLSDPEVIQAFATTVESERRLTALYLLTVADIRGTSPKVWNAWKGKLLEDLYRMTRRLLRGGSAGMDQDVQAKQAEAQRLLRLYALSDNVTERLWKELDTAYFLRHDAQEIAWQARTLHYRVDADKPVVKARLSPIGEGVQVMIYVRDQRELFARICGYFESINFSIVDAKIHTTRHGYALDTFFALGSDVTHHYRDMLNLIEHDLEARLANREELPPPARGRVSRHAKHFPITPEVHVRPDEKNQYHLLSVTAGDRPGLLYAIARVLSRYDINLRTAKIVTLGERAEDVFLIDGAALDKPATVVQLESDLVAALQ